MKNKILFVEDDPFYARRYIAALEDAGYDVMPAADATSGFLAFEEAEASLAAVVMDMAMEGGERFDDRRTKGGNCSGLELAKLIYRRASSLPLLAISNLIDSEAEVWFRNRHLHVLEKRAVSERLLVEYVKKSIDKSYRMDIPVFIVHGHDHDFLYEFKDFLQKKLNIPHPVILHEQRSGGQTIIEKFEHHATDVMIAFVLMTPDDVVGDGAGGENRYRPRQNVIWEHGYFSAGSRRRKGQVIILQKGEIELPSDLEGIVRIDVSKGVESAETQIRRELSEWF